MLRLCLRIGQIGSSRASHEAKLQAPGMYFSYFGAEWVWSFGWGALGPSFGA